MDIFKEAQTPAKSTPLKEQPSFQLPKSISFGIRTLQQFAPGLAYKVALRIFFTPVKYPTPERELAYKNSANMYRNEVDGKKITVYQSGKGTKKVMLVHGWSGRATQFFQIEKELTKAGYQVYSFTAPAHGSSDDKQTHMLEFAACIKMIDKTYGPFNAFVGHSMGGMAIMNATIEKSEDTKIVLIGVPAYIKGVIDDFAEKLSLQPKIAKRIEKFLIDNYDTDYEQFSTARLAKSTKAQGLILHDANDRDVLFSEAEIIHAAWPNSTLQKTKELGHRRILSEPSIAKKIAKFLG